MALEIPLPWERLLWSGHSARPGGRRIEFVLTDFRLVRMKDDDVEEVALQDITDIRCSQSRLDRLLGTETVAVATRRSSNALVLQGLRRGTQIAALLEILSAEPRTSLDREAVRAVLDWDPRGRPPPYRETLASIAVAIVALLAVTHLVRGTRPVTAIASDNPLYADGKKRPQQEIVEFMEHDVMPWARTALAPIKGGADHVTCKTCHGPDAETRAWQMPAVAALPQPDLRQQGWERYGGAMDAQMRNAIYGYLADSDKQGRAGYMREVVMPGMAALLHRPPYDFTQPYAYNLSRMAFGCYHCHRID